MFLNDAEGYRQLRGPSLSKEEHWFPQHTISHIRCWPYGSRLRPPSGRRKDKELTSAYYPPKVVAQRRVLNPLGS